MLEYEQSLLPRKEQGKPPLAVCVGLETESLAELDRLLGTLGVEPVGHIQAVVRKINPATYFGRGKLEEVQLEVERRGADVVIMDLDLSPNQLRNIEKVVGKPVIDRPGVIIEIFSAHARTKESKTQVELARLEYLLPRLAHFWTHFERQRGGIGMKGMGEKQIEVDRRLVKTRMSVLKQRLKSVENERNIQRSGRKDVLKVAIVGYTNAGKSTLINALTQSRVLAENKLFATLDSSVRSIDPDCHPPVVAIDTVGFIRNLPHSLVASFKSTLEELEEADLLLHVVDASSTQAREEMAVTEQVLSELGVAGTPRITVLNKVDAIPASVDRIQAKLIAPGSVMVSALDPSDVRKLREMILDHFKKGLEIWELVVPYGESKLESQLHANGSVEKIKHLEKGTFYRLRIDESWAKKLDLKRYRL